MALVVLIKIIHTPKKKSLKDTQTPRNMVIYKVFAINQVFAEREFIVFLYAFMSRAVKLNCTDFRVLVESIVLLVVSPHTSCQKYCTEEEKWKKSKKPNIYCIALRKTAHKVTKSTIITDPATRTALI